MFRTSLLLLALCVFYAHARTESTAVQGTLYCNKLPAATIQVRLIDHYKATSDKTMAAGLTNNRGEYYLAGYNDPTLSGIDPYVRIDHNCGGRSKCHKFDIPDQYITKGKTPLLTYSAPDIELSTAPDNC